MVELTDAFLAALTRGGLHARSAREAGISPRLKGSAVAVETQELDTSPGGFSSYLGLQDGKELYGMRLQAKMRLDVRSPVKLGAGECRNTMDLAAGVLAQGVEGVSIGRILAHAPEYDPVEDCFAGVIEVCCHGWMCAEASQEAPGEFEHFILKGVLT
ncbi:MAG: hypothetical protein E7464_03755 [Ruminococcaceae bacterium]|nr:hypothetical protein [Oscillospiraceae bacterium]